MLHVNLVSFEDLTDEEKEIQPNNGWGKECANYIKITDRTETVMILSDSFEPEDGTFTRDLCYVVDAIKEAYKIGLRDGRKINN
ncbi:hypothetical protein K7T73_13125 [Bacillus badius]|uniref:hypothetical protein n=1 Tax=Bacillus badius TaxID=1455 RepID=UPI001CBFFF40|nr:hypothetical protein [Bacillus badius]UAT29541.1 hypothetical protein K7T73_13125 [Bacillus badius]